MAVQMSVRLMTLCTVAVGSIYAAGYFVTSNSVHPVNPASTQSGTGVSSGAPSVTPVGTQSAGTQTSGNSASPATNTRTSTQGKYRDGVFNGSGTNPYGTVAVALTIRGGRIVSVNITRCTTHYPQSFIDPVLPNMVMARQSWQVDIVSGATASTYDFAEAVYSALQKAKAS